jgi:hypothetical protein
MSTTPSPIYSLLPAVFRNRDVAQGGPLQALFAVLESQYGLVQDNLAQLYDDQFIETCAPWVIPYLGQLIGYNTVFTAALTSPDSRAEVANTIGYRRRKGTLVALEQITHDVSGRSTMAVEEFRNLATTVSMRDVRVTQFATASIRTGADLEDLNGPFTGLSRTIDVRNISPRSRIAQSPDTAPLDIALHGPGRFNIPQVSVWMWRWQSFAVSQAPAFSLGNGGYYFSSLGGPIPLFQPATSLTAFASLVQEADVPEPISLQRFSANLDGFYSGSMNLIADGKPVPVGQITCANLGEALDGSVCAVPKGMIAIDPQIGRIQYGPGVALPKELQVSYNYGAPALMGGGYYDRTTNITEPGTQPGIEFVNSSNLFEAIVGSAKYPTLHAAVAAWNKLPKNSAGTIILPNFDSYAIDLTGTNAIQIPAESQLLIASASFTSAAGAPPEWTNSCVTLRGNIEVHAPTIPVDSDGVSLPAGSLLFSGLWISGQLIFSGDEACVQLADCTLVPGISLTAKGDAAHPEEPSITGSAIDITLVLNRVISGPITLPPTCTARICSSIVDAGTPYCPAIAGLDLASPGPALHIEDSTVIGRVWAQAIQLASNTIFWAKMGCLDPWAAPVIANRVQIGCVRFSWFPANSILPKQYLCLASPTASGQVIEPTFITLRFGSPGYCLLSGDVPLAIWKGADNGSQMGVYYQMQETEAVTNIQIRSAEYLPANLQCGVFLIPSSSVVETVPTMEYGYGVIQAPSRCGCTETEDLPFGIGIGLI